MFAAKNEGFPNLHRSGQSALTAVFEVVMILPSSRPTVCAAPVPPGRIIEVVQDLQEMGNHRPINTKNHTSQTVSAHCFFFLIRFHILPLYSSQWFCVPGGILMPLFARPIVKLSRHFPVLRGGKCVDICWYTCWYAILRYVEDLRTADQDGMSCAGAFRISCFEMWASTVRSNKFLKAWFA